MRREEPPVRLPEISDLRVPLLNHPYVAVVDHFLTLDPASFVWPFTQSAKYWPPSLHLVTRMLGWAETARQ